MKVSYELTTDLDLGLLGLRGVSVSYSYDKRFHVTNLMSVHLLDGQKLGPEITDYLSCDGEDFLYERINVDLQSQLNDEAEYAAECQRERLREAAWEIEQSEESAYYSELERGYAKDRI